jgi:hypothetical protein
MQKRMFCYPTVLSREDTEAWKSDHLWHDTCMGVGDITLLKIFHSRSQKGCAVAIL